jgi:hypothetical protein
MDALDSGPMETRDRRANLAIFGVAFLAWLVVGWVVLNLDPRADPSAGFIGGVVMGIAVGLTTAPLFWLAAFSRHRRIAYRGDWARALRRGGWVAILVALFIVMRVQGIFQPPIGLFLAAMVLVAEMTISAQR